MKKLLVTLAAVLVSVSSYAQGTLAFNTLVSGAVNAPTYAPGGTATTTGVGTLGTVNAQLFLVSSGTHTVGGNPVYTPLTPATTYLTTGTARHVVVPPTNVEVPGRAPGETVQIILRAWKGGTSYDTATEYIGQTPLGGAATVRLGGQPASGPSITPGNLVGLQGFEVTVVPEPSTIAFGLLGAAALLYRRRK